MRLRREALLIRYGARVTSRAGHPIATLFADLRTHPSHRLESHPRYKSAFERLTALRENENIPFVPDLGFVTKRLRRRWALEWRSKPNSSQTMHQLRPRLPPPQESQLRDRRRRQTWTRHELAAWHGLRLRASKLNEHLYHAGLRSSPACRCGFPLETAYHFLMGCAEHADSRRSLLDVLNRLHVPMTIETLLAGDRRRLSSRDADTLDDSMRRFLSATTRLD